MTSTDLLIAACALLGLGVVSATILVGWQNWLAFKNRELDLRRAGAPPSGEGGRFAREGAARIELADLKERVRRLEAIANGVDL
jgi:hypothetical protein